MQSKRIPVNAVLALTGVTASLLLILMFLVVATVNFAFRVQDNLVAEGKEIVNRMSLTLSKAFWDLDPDSLQQIMAGEMGNPDLVFARLTKTDHSVFLELGHTGKEITTSFDQMKVPLPVMEYSLEQSKAITYSHIEIGTITIRLSSAARIANFFQDMVGTIAAQLFLSFLIVLLIMVAVQRLFINPLVQITKVIDQFAQQNFLVPIPPFSSREMHTLATGLGDMAQTITAYQTQMEKLVDLRTTQLLESAKFAQMGIFLSGLAHEMNTPLGNSLLAASYLNERVASFEKDSLAGKVSLPALVAFLADVKQAGTLTLRGVERSSQFLMVLKTLGIDDKPQGEKVIRIDRFLDELLLAFKLEGEEHGVTLESQAVPGLSLKLHVSILYQVLSNLLFLTLDHGFEKRKEGIIHCSAAFNGEILTLTCKDNGTGMDPSQLEHLFSPFGLSGDSLSKDPEKKLLRQTLGPYVLQSLLKSVRGDLKGTSTRGVGTTFVITIPAQKADVAST